MNKCKSIAVTVHQYVEILHAGKWQWKKVSFKFLFKCRQCHWDVTSDGRLFQVFAAATQNARSPTVWRRVCGTARSAEDAERKRCRPGRLATWHRLSLRYVGARPLRHRNATTASLKDIRCGARSQCSRWSRGMICCITKCTRNLLIYIHVVCFAVFIKAYTPN